jgi:serine/threonine-protein kinase
MIGETIAHYRITAKLGEGGMGEVYRATDTKLGREVAIKILPQAVANDPDRLARFEREAKVLAALNHPHIAQIYGVEERALVMELVEGEDLHGPLPLATALDYAHQIAEALEAAHEKGITHRDLKPANVKVTPGGVVKVLDFGLAKAADESAPSGNPSISPTLTLGATQLGMILGTAAYMSPEQAAGKPVDKRADIWSFGVVLWEMLTGRRLFDGESVAHTLADVLRANIDFTRLPQETPPAIRELLERCLDRDLKTRLQAIGEARIAIQKYLANPTSVDALPKTAPSKSRLGWLAWSVAGLAVAAALTFVHFQEAPPAPPLMRFNDDLGAEISSASSFGPALAISRDGSRLAFVSAGSDGATHLSVRLLAASKSTVLAGTEGAAGPFFSPDSRWIAFFADQKLKKISVDGGAAVTLCAAQIPRGGFWGEDGNILFADQLTPVLRVSSSGGTPQPATQLDKQKGEVTHRQAQLLPGGEALLFTASRDNNYWDEATIQVQSIKTGKRKTLVQGGTSGRYLASSSGAGYLLYVHGATLFAAPMDLKRLELAGPPSPVIEDVASHLNNGFSEFAFTPAGTFVYLAGSRGAVQRSLCWLDSSGSPQALSATPADYTDVHASPDGTRIAVQIRDSSAINIAVYEWAQNRMTKLTFLKSGTVVTSAWTPDGKHLVFHVASQELSGSGIYWMRADGAGEPQRLLGGPNFAPYSFSPDGKRVVYSRYAPDFGIWTLPLDLTDPEHPKPGKPELFLGSKSIVRIAAFSPDGRWIAYDSVESGQPEIYVRPFPGPGGRWQVSTGGGTLGTIPFWSRNGHDLYYVRPEGIWVASYTAKGDAFAAGQPRRWSEKLPPFLALDLMPDGKRFIAILPTSAGTTADRPTHVTFLLNFADELRRRVPAGNK